MGIGKIVQGHRESMLQIAARYGADEVRIFGSVARGDSGPDSDVDILVTLEQGRTLLDLVALKQDLEDLLGCKVDVVTELAISPYIREQVLESAVIL